MCHWHTQSLTYGTSPSCPGCRSVWGGGARAGTVAEGTGTALEITEPPALSFPHQQPTASLTLRSGFVLEGETQGSHIRKTPLGAALLQGRFPEQQFTFFFFFSPTSLSSPFNFSISFPNGSLGDSQPRAAPKGGLTPSPPSQVRSATEQARAPLPSLGTGNMPSPPVLRPLSTDPCVFPPRAE